MAPQMRAEAPLMRLGNNSPRQENQQQLDYLEVQPTPKVSGEVLRSHPSHKNDSKDDIEGETPREQAPLYFEEAK